jgi:serine protease Do
MAPYLRSWDEMKRGSSVHTWARGSGGWIGLSTEAAEGALHILAVAPESPALKAGLKAGDVILSLNNKMLAAPVEFAEAIRNRVAGEIVTLKVRSGPQERTVEVKLGKRPEE